MEGVTREESIRQRDSEEQKRLKVLLIALAATIVIAAAIYSYLLNLRKPYPTGDPTFYTGPIWNKPGTLYATIDGKILKYNKQRCEEAGIPIPSGATVVDGKREYIQP